MSLILGLGQYLTLKILKAVKKEDAVSPVVGVMLMTVVTIVISTLYQNIINRLECDSCATILNQSLL